MNDDILYRSSLSATRHPALSSMALVTLATLPIVAPLPSEAEVSSLTPVWDDAATFIPNPDECESLEPSVSAGTYSWADIHRERAHELSLLRRVVDVLQGRFDLAFVPPSLAFAVAADLRRAPPYTLRTLRSRIVEELRDFDAWLSVMRALQPDADGIEVPDRFVTREEATTHDEMLFDDLAAAVAVEDMLSRG